MPAKTKGKTSAVVSKDGTQIALERSGSGPALILVNGALSERSAHQRIATLLAPHFTVIIYDRRGRGDSGDTQPYSVDREIEDIEALVDDAGGTAFLFGASSGAALALEAVARLPAKVPRLAIFEPPFSIDRGPRSMPSDFVQHVSKLISDGRRGAAIEYFMTKAVGVPPEMVAQMQKQPMWAAMEKMAHTLAYDGAIMRVTQQGETLRTDRWASVKTPTLVIDGDRSDAFLRSAADAIANALPNAQHKTLAGQDHSVVFSSPQTIAPVLVEFFKR